MHPEHEHTERIAAALERLAGEAPSTAIVLGSGLGGVVDALEIEQRIPYPEVGLPQSTVKGHAGELVIGRLGGERVVVCSGRVHLYEGLGANVVVRAVRSLHRWGIERMVLTCSVGGIREGLDMGSLVCVTDHINMQNDHPLTGEAYGTRFPDMTNAYHPGMREAIHGAAARVGATLHNGVLAAMNGPAYETPAEVRMVRTLGADLVGMSTVPEVLAAAEIGLPVAVVSVVSNRAAGLSGETLNHEEVTEAAAIAAGSLVKTLIEAISSGALRTATEAE